MFAFFPPENLTPPPQDNIQLVNQIIRSIPVTATVGAQYLIAPHIQKPFGKLTPWPNYYLNEPDYIIWDTKLPPILTEWKTDAADLRALSTNPKYQLIVNHGGVIVFKKINQ
jgi:hypothetical protein